MGRPREYGDRVQTQVRLPVDVHSRLVVEARERDVSVNYLIGRAVAEWLDQHGVARAWPKRAPRKRGKITPL